jgi:hypothetical protein
MGTAFVAIANDPSAINFNPPSLVSIKGTKRHGGGIIVVPSREFKSPAGATKETSFRAFCPPQVAVGAGLGIFSASSYMARMVEQSLLRAGGRRLNFKSWRF